MFLMMSFTRLLRFWSFWIASVTLFTEYTIVEWSRQPNSVPIDASGICVISLTTYIATLRAMDTC